MASLFASLPAPAANGSGAAVDVSTFGATKTFIISGAWDLQPIITIEFNNSSSSSDGGWQSLRSVQGAAAPFTIDVACKWLRVTVQNFRGGMAPVVNVGGTDDGTTLVNLPAPAGDGDGTPVDTSALPSFKTIQVASSFRGAVVIELSTDGGATYGQAYLFYEPGYVSGVFAADFMRVSRNGVPGVAPGLPVVNVGASTGSGGGGGGGGVDLENAGVSVAGGPFQTLDLFGLTAADLGSGVASITNPGSGNPQRFQYTVTGAEPDLSELTIALPAARANALYLVTPSWANWSALMNFGVKNTSRTTAQFVLSLAAPATAGDIISFTVTDPT